MQKFDITRADHGVSDFDESLGAMWSDHCINPFTSFEMINDTEIILTGKDGQYKGRATLDLLSAMGEAC